MDCGDRETFEAMDARIRAYLSFIRDRPERSIAVVGHSATFARMFEKHLQWAEDNGPFRLNNTQIRSMVITFHPKP